MSRSSNNKHFRVAVVFRSQRVNIRLSDLTCGNIRLAFGLDASAFYLCDAQGNAEFADEAGRFNRAQQMKEAVYQVTVTGNNTVAVAVEEEEDKDEEEEERVRQK